MKSKKDILTVKKNSAAVELGRKGGLARAAALTAARRKEIATNAVKARWDKHRRSLEDGS